MAGCSIDKKSDENKVTCTLTGTISDRKDGNLFLYQPESSRFDQDTIQFKNGHFEFTKTINSPEVYEIFFEEDLSVGPFLPIGLFIENGNVDITLSFENRTNYQVKGGKLNDQLIKISEKLMLLTDEITKLYKSKSSLPDTLLRIKSDSLDNQYKNLIIDYLTENKNLISAHLLWAYRSWLGKDKLEVFLPSLKSSFPNSKYIIETNAYLEGFGKSQPQQHFTDFKLLDTQENEISLSNITNNHKLTFFLFWSSRCTASDGKLQSYIKIYNDYRDSGFEIIGISNDYDLTRWKNAIKRNKVVWINLLDPDGENAIDEYYHTNTKGDVLIDQNGTIVARIFQSSQLKDTLEKRLK